MVRHYDVVPESYCKKLIEIFENSSNQEFINNDYKPCFSQVNLNKETPELVRQIIPIIKGVHILYKKETKSHFLPELNALEEFRIKRYLPNGEERFDEHVDVTDYPSSRRSVAFLFYLNTNDGSTVFSKQKLNIKPKCGRVVVFPPTWEYPHAGLPPTTSNKYIMSTYIHYG
jgi:hypothetical protein